MAILDHGSYAVNGSPQAAAPVKTSTCLAVVLLTADATTPAARVCTSAAQVAALVDTMDIEDEAVALATYIFAAGVPEIVAIIADDATDAAATLKAAYRTTHRKINLVWAYATGNTATTSDALTLATASKDIIGRQSYDAIVYADMPWDAVWTDADATTAAAIATASRALASHPKNMALHTAKVSITKGASTLTIGNALPHAVRQVLVDAANSDVPFEGASNYELPGDIVSISTAFSREDGNACNAAGVDVIIYDDGYKLWGDYLSSYDLEGTTDADGIFIQQQRMLQYLRASFCAQWKSAIDRSFTRQLRDTIIATEQAKLDRLVAMGALIGNPKIEFLPADNPSADLLQGHFFWRVEVSPALPLTSAKLSVAYTDSGYAVLFE